MEVKKSIRMNYDETKANQLFYNLLKYFPINFQSFTDKIYEENTHVTNFWFNRICRFLKSEGYMYAYKLDPKSYSALTLKWIYTNDSIAKDFTNGFFSNLKEINTTPNENGIYIKNNSFQAAEALLKTFFGLLKIIDEKGGWTGDYIKNNLKEIDSFFSLKRYPLKKMITLDIFCKNVNEIIETFLGKSIIALYPDGNLEYIESTEELHQEFVAIRSLQKRKMDSVVESIYMIRKSNNDKDFNTGLFQCRKTIENFFKDFLSFHSILDNGDPTNAKKVSEMMVNQLLTLTKKKINVLFKHPQYTNPNTVKTMLDNYLEAIKNMTSAITNPFSHGKGTSTSTNNSPPQATQEDLDMMFRFIIGIINTLLFFEK